jgi:hypothetical protein
MAIVLSWIKQSRSATYDRGKWSGSQNYLVRDTTDQAINVYDIASGASTYEVFGAGDDTTMATYMRFVSATYTPVSDGMDRIWSAVFTFESTMGDGVNIVTADVKTETEVGFTSIETNIREEAIDIWRTGTTVPSGGTQNDSDIGGTKSDSAGEPISFLLPIVSISIRNVIYGRPQYATIMAIAGKRNSASFTFGATGNTFTCATGTLVFTGASTSRTGPNVYEINYQFNYDPTLYHMRQIAMRDLKGVKTSRPTPGSPVSATNVETASVVFWRQPFPDTTAFSALGIVST